MSNSNKGAMPDTKDSLRKRYWNLLQEENAGAFPFPLNGRIPNFKGSNDASRQLKKIPPFNRAETLKANPDAPQRKARELALREGKHLFMAVPRLREQHPFRKIIARETAPSKAVTIKGSQKYGQPLPPSEMPEIDLIITGSVAVHRDGRRLGKGGGYSDLEFALLTEFGKVIEETVIVTTVHPLQVSDRDIPFHKHDIPVDYILTPDEIIETESQFERPPGLIPTMLNDKYLEEIPILREMLDG